MQVIQESDGTMHDVYVKIGATKEYRFTISNHDGLLSAIYETPEGLEYEILRIEKNGTITNDTPKTI